MRTNLPSVVPKSGGTGLVGNNSSGRANSAGHKGKHARGVHAKGEMTVAPIARVTAADRQTVLTVAVEIGRNENANARHVSRGCRSTVAGVTNSSL